MSFPYRTAWTSEPQLWEWHKDRIKYLYLHENLTLKEVAEVMEEKHNFRATTKMYKYYFHKWGFRKNLRACESQKLLEARSVPGEASSLPVVHGRQLGSKRLKSKILRPAFKCEEGIIGTRDAGQQPPNMLLPLAKAIDMPDHLRFADDSLRAVGTYVKAYQNTWNLTYIPNRSTETYLWKDKILYAVWQISENQNLAASFKILSKACDEFQIVIKKHEPIIVLFTYSIILQLLSTRVDLARVIIRLFADYCSIYFGKNHPLAKVWTSMIHMDADDICRLALPIVDMQFNTFRNDMICNGLVGDLFEAQGAKKLRDLGLISCEVAHARIDNCVQRHRSIESTFSGHSSVRNKALLIGNLLWKATVHVDTQDWAAVSLVLDEVERIFNGFDEEMMADSEVRLHQVSYLEIRSAQLEQLGDKYGAQLLIERALVIAREFLAKKMPGRVGFCYAAVERFYVRTGNLKSAQAVRPEYTRHMRLIMGDAPHHEGQQQHGKNWERARMATAPRPCGVNSSS